MDTGKWRVDGRTPASHRRNKSLDSKMSESKDKVRDLKLKQKRE